jgi:hypothetical protein
LTGVDGEPENIIAFRTMAAILAKIQTRSLNFETDRNVKDLPKPKSAELRMLDSLATIAVMDRDVIAVVAAKHDDINNVSNTNWKPSLEVLAAPGSPIVGVGQAVSEHSSKKGPLVKRMLGLNTGRKDKDIRKPNPQQNSSTTKRPFIGLTGRKDKDITEPIPQQDSSTTKRPLKRLMFSVNTRPDDKNSGRLIPQEGIPIILEAQPPAHFDLNGISDNPLATYVRACW